MSSRALTFPVGRTTIMTGPRTLLAFASFVTLRQPLSPPQNNSTMRLTQNIQQPERSYLSLLSSRCFPALPHYTLSTSTFFCSTIVVALGQYDRQFLMAAQQKGQQNQFSVGAGSRAPPRSNGSIRAQNLSKVSNSFAKSKSLQSTQNGSADGDQSRFTGTADVQLPQPFNDFSAYRQGASRGGRKQQIGNRMLEYSFVLFTGTQHEKRRFLDTLMRGEQEISLAQFNEAVTALCRMRRIQDALALVQVWDQKPLSDVVARARSVKSYKIMIDVYGKAKQLTRAFSLFHSMSKLGTKPSLVTYNAMVAACARNNEPDLAYEVFEDMRANGLTPDKFTYGALIDTCARNGQVERAFELSRFMDADHIVKDSMIYSALMDACGRASQLERAFLVFEEMKRNGIWPNLVTFAVLIGMCADAREPERAFQLFSEIKHWGNFRPNVVVYSALIDVCAKAGWPARAEHVLTSMVENGVRPNEISYGALMEGWTRRGHIDQAFSIIDRMVDEHHGIPNAVLVGRLIDACKRLGKINRVRSIWSIMVKYNVRPSPYYYPALITMAAKNGDIDVASAIALHAYARGSLRRVSLNSENPTLRALACAIAYLNHVILHEVPLGEQRQKYLERLRIVFNSTAMTSGQIENVSADDAYNCCLSGGADSASAVFPL